MASQGSFSSSVGSASPASSTSAASVAASPATVFFSVFQEGPGRPLVFAPPRGTPELQALVDLFIALDVPVSMKMEMIQRDFEAHAARTNERYKTYFVPSASTPAASAAASVTSPSTFTASPSPIFHNVFDATFTHNASSGSGSGSGSLYLDASPAPRPSPTESLLTVASDSVFPLSVPMFPTHQFADVNAAAFNGNFFPIPAVDHSPVAMTAAASMWPATSMTATAAPVAPVARRSQPRRSAAAPAPSQRRRLSGSSSMQILTRSGEDVTHMSSRGTRTHEERENTRLVRQRGACPDCRRKKTRCNPDHAGFTAEHVSSSSSARTGPYSAPAQSGRAKAEAAAAKAAKASKAKADGKRAAAAAAEPIIFTAPQTAPSAAVLAGIEDGGGGGFGHIPPLLDMNLFSDSCSFDWDQLTADQGGLLTEEDLELSIATTLSMTTAPAAATATASGSGSSSGSSSSTTQDHTDSYSVPPFRPPPPHRPTDARLQSRRNVIATSSAPASAPVDQSPQMGRMSANDGLGFNGFNSSAAFATNSAIFGEGSGSGSGSVSGTGLDSGSLFSIVNASMTGSCVQPGSFQTGGLTRDSALRTEEIDLGRDEGDLGRRVTANVGDERGREGGTDQDLGQDHDRLQMERERQRRRERRESSRTESRTTTTPSTTLTATTTPTTTTSTTTATTTSSSPPSSSTSPLSPADAAVLLTVIVNFTASLIPAYMAWTAAAQACKAPRDRKDEKNDKNNLRDLEVRFDQMNLGPALVACQ